MSAIRFDAAAIWTALDDSAAAGNNSFTSLANGSAVLSGTSHFDGSGGPPSSIDNSSGGARTGDLWMDLSLALVLSTTSGIATNPTLDVYLLPQEDGTNYADGTAGASPTTLAGCYVGSFVARSTTSQQFCAPLKGIPLPPCKCQLQVVNNTGVALGGQNAGTALKVKTYRPQTP
jgi:hypothetical protein